MFFLRICKYGCHVLACYLWRSEETIHSLGTEVMLVVHHVGGQSSGPLQEQKCSRLLSHLSRTLFSFLCSFLCKMSADMGVVLSSRFLVGFVLDF